MPYTSRSGVRLYWEEEGSGVPLLMLMGLSFSMHMWGNLRGAMARHFRAILIDNRASGRSSVPALPFTIRDMAADAVAVLDDAGVASADVLSFSMGGMIAQELALRWPTRVRRLILGCTHCGGLHAVLAKPRVLKIITSPLLPLEARLNAIVPYIYHPGTPGERIEQDLAALHENAPSAYGYMQQVGAILRWSSYRRLPRINAPALVIHGEEDQLVPSANAGILAGRIPGAKLALIPGAGHVFPTDQPERTLQELLAFLSVPD